MRRLLPAQSLVSLLVIVLIVAALVVLLFFFQPSSARRHIRTSGTGETALGDALQKAGEVDCLNNLRQWRLLIQNYRAEHEALPTDLRLLPGYQGWPSTCPITRQPYSYDPSTGSIICPSHPNF